ncbi:type VI secretion system Vgr family protein [Pseudomonas sp. KNUC1026]|uniref:type VI secretion system Vgr family protein n=1 Tax=Pseudomonas sp. KNUC1026 TaxID=2893890 RepID=UPI001F37327C|nr:type VI secretion system tip protein VgrG [Pseudomonas sp. KNUC1026]UFH51059.1 type VI secretion system tip protein VgrG [Pseudomonas sp. KNUC1026]
MADSRYRLDLAGLPLDVLSLEGHEHLSQVFTYRVRCTCRQHDIGRHQVLTQPATLRFLSASARPLRSMPGVITGFAHLRTSVDETLYEFTLQPRLALLGRGQGSHLYRNLSVPQIVEQVLCQRHGWPAPALQAGDLLHAYPPLEQVVQFEESDLAFIERLLAEAGIWYRLAMHETLDSEVMVLGDRAAQHYLAPVPLPVRPRSGQVGAEDAVWDLQSQHQVVEQSASVHHYAYQQRIDEQDCPPWLRADDTNSDFGNLSPQGTYGDACHLAMAYQTKGCENQARAPFTENTAYRAAHQGHERYLNQRTRLRGTTSSVLIVPGRLLAAEYPPSMPGLEPALLERGLLVTDIHLSGARDQDLAIHFEGMPHGAIEFRPPLKPKPVMAGTVAAFVSAPQPPEADLDEQGHYRVTFRVRPT